MVSVCVELVALAAADPARREEALVDVGERAAEADEGARPDHAGHLALEAGAGPALEQLPLEQEARRRRESASRSIAVASRSRSEQWPPTSPRPLPRGRASSPAPIAESSARWATRSG